MKASHIVNELLEGNDWARELIGEASVHRPRRRRIWVASCTGPEGQEWRSTGTADPAVAVARAKECEAAARVQRANSARTARKQMPRIRPTAGGAGGGLTQREVGLRLDLSERAVRAIEKRALRKLAQHPRLRELWRQFLAGELTEQGHQLSAPEIQALLGLTRSRAELAALRKALARVKTQPSGPGPGEQNSTGPLNSRP